MTVQVGILTGVKDESRKSRRGPQGWRAALCIRDLECFPTFSGHVAISFPETGESRVLTETKVFGEKYVLRADAKHSDFLHPSLPKSGAHSMGQLWGGCCLPLEVTLVLSISHSPPPSKLSAGQAILLKTLLHPLE